MDIYDHLELQDFMCVVRDYEKVSLSEGAKTRIEQGRNYVLKLLQEEKDRLWGEYRLWQICLGAHRPP
ncbi:MAG: hypothetical protein R2880_18845 [Deinococcales bacterium]